jgi:hypothetical protein
VSVQSAAGANQAATQAALQPLEPHGILFVPQGFVVIFKAEFSDVDPIANSSIFTLPKVLIQAFFKFSITVELYGGTKFSSIFEAQVVGTHFSQNMSFTAIGIHASSHSQIFKPSLFT